MTPAHAAGAHGARAIVVATDDPETTLAIVRTVRRSFPEAALLVRAHDRIHAVRLADEDMPADAIVRETLASALELGARALEALGHGEGEAREVVARIRRRDAARLDEQIAAARGRDGRRAIVDAIAPEPLTRRGRASRDAAARTGAEGTKAMTAIEGAKP